MLHARIGKAVETTEAIAKHARSGLDVVKGIVLDREGGNAAQLRIDRSAVPCFDGHHERDFVRRSAPTDWGRVRFDHSRAARKFPLRARTSGGATEAQGQ
jgi:hypothetical protein